MTEQKTTSQTLNIFLWIGQVLLAFMFIYAGVMKTFQPIDELSQMLPWVTEYSKGFVRFVGLADLVGGIGVLLPYLFRWKTELTRLAALGIVTIMILAIGFHIIRGEYVALPMNIVLGGIAIFIAWGRKRTSL